MSYWREKTTSKQNRALLECTTRTIYMISLTGVKLPELAHEKLSDIPGQSWLYLVGRIKRCTCSKIILWHCILIREWYLSTNMYSCYGVTLFMRLQQHCFGYIYMYMLDLNFLCWAYILFLIKRLLFSVTDCRTNYILYNVSYSFCPVMS